MAKKMYVGVNNVARKVKRIYVGAEPFEARTLPAGYTQVAYIGSSGTQYIDTGFKPNQDTRIVIDLDVTATSAQCALFGSRNSGGSGAFAVFTYDNNNGYQDDYASSQKYPVGGASSGRHILDKNKNVFSVDGQTVNTSTYASFTGSYSALLLSIKNAGSALTSLPTTAKLYSCQIYDNGTLVRDFVPCKNASGTIGLYDLVGGAFYANAGTGTFTAGVTNDVSVARKVKKGYIGVGGVARPFWTGGELVYFGTVTALSQGRHKLAATTVGNYALFGGGSISGGRASTIDAYNASLVHSTPTGLTVARKSLAAASVGNYAFFGGGQGSSNRYLYDTVNVYDSSATRAATSTLSEKRSDLAATNIGNYVLFGGGLKGSQSYSSVVDVYDTSLTKTTATALSPARQYLDATHVGNYALFGGGSNSDLRNQVDAYDASLTKGSATLSIARRYMGVTQIGDYALFAGGQATTSYTDSDVVDAFNNSLTRTTVTALSVARQHPKATTVGDFAVIGGGYQKDTVDVYDASLTRTIGTPLSQARYLFAAATVGNYALFAGGTTNGTQYYTTVDAYTVA